MGWGIDGADPEAYFDAIQKLVLFNLVLLFSLSGLRQ